MTRPALLIVDGICAGLLVSALVVFVVLVSTPIDAATVSRYRALGCDALRRARELCLAGPYFKGGPSRHRSKRGRLALARAMKEARWAYTACARVVLVNRDQLARAHAEAERRNGWEDHLQAQRGIVA